MMLAFGRCEAKLFSFVELVFCSCWDALKPMMPKAAFSGLCWLLISSMMLVGKVKRSRSPVPEILQALGSPRSGDALEVVVVGLRPLSNAPRNDKSRDS